MFASGRPPGTYRKMSKGSEGYVGDFVVRHGWQISRFNMGGLHQPECDGGDQLPGGPAVSVRD